MQIIEVWSGNTFLVSQAGLGQKSPLHCKLNKKLITALCAGVKMHPLPSGTPHKPLWSCRTQL
jgi:hypothetical protein